MPILINARGTSVTGPEVAPERTWPTRTPTIGSVTVWEVLIRTVHTEGTEKISIDVARAYVPNMEFYRATIAINGRRRASQTFFGESAVHATERFVNDLVSWQHAIMLD